MRAILVATSLYFGLIFGTGFVLGTFRVLVLLPILGERIAELLEAPIMIVAIILAARFVIRRFPARPTLAALLAVGLSALSTLLVVEFTIVLWMRGLTIQEYLASRDPVAGAVYVASLILFALAPTLVGSRLGSRDRASAE